MKKLSVLVGLMLAGAVLRLASTRRDGSPEAAGRTETAQPREPAAGRNVDSLRPSLIRRLGRETGAFRQWA
ncbi:MAG TPA: hypothetical protein VHM91_08265, partial [Verrucomicrobiales bacterium]|nr:hypothetical protein [Verrucomicrobiales bacterium]